MARTGTQFAKLTGDYSSINVYATWQLRKQDASTGESTIRLREYLNYSYAGTYASSYSTFKLNGTTVKSGSYSYSTTGDHLVGYKDITVKHNEDGTFPDTKLTAYAYSYHFTDKPSKTVTLTSADIPDIQLISVIESVSGSKDLLEDTDSSSSVVITNTIIDNYVTTLSALIGEVEYTILENLTTTNIVVCFDQDVYNEMASSDKPHVYVEDLDWKKICNLIPNEASLDITFRLTTFEDNTYTVELGQSEAVYTFTINKASFEWQPYLQADDNTVSLTGNNKTFIQTVSQLTSYANVIASKNGATVSEYGHGIQISYIDDNATSTTTYSKIPTYTYENIGGNNIEQLRFLKTLIDSRGFSITSESMYVPSEEYTLIRYTKPILENATVQRPEQLAPYVYMSISGSFWNNNFGVVQNEMKLQYRYKLNTQEDYTNWLDLDPTINEDGTFSFHSNIGSEEEPLVLPENSATFEVRVIDSTGSEAKEINFTIPKGKSMFDLGENYLSWNGELCINDEEVPCFVEENANEDGSRNIQLYDSEKKKIFPNTYKVGDIYISSQNINPEAQFGGTWELIDKEFKEKYSSTEDNLFAINTTNASSAEMSYVRSGHTIRVRVAVDNKVSLSDTDVTLGTLDIQSLGFTTFISTPNIFSYINDDVMGICYYVYNTGELKWRGLISSTATSLGSGSTITTDMVAVLTPAYMLDEFCDRFYWKRIS